MDSDRVLVDLAFFWASGRVLSSQTIGVEFSSKIVKIGSGARRKRIKLQLWDTAGTERFRSVSRSYYRGAAGAILVYDVSSYASFGGLPTFLMDARALASPNLTVVLAGNKSDLAHPEDHSSAATSFIDDPHKFTPSSVSTTSTSRQSSSVTQPPPLPFDSAGGSVRSTHSNAAVAMGTRWTATKSSHGREVDPQEALDWATKSNIPVAVEVSALSGENVEELFTRLARIILTKIELGEIDPDDPQSGIQYGDGGMWMGGSRTASDGGSIRSALTLDDPLPHHHHHHHRRRPRRKNDWMGEWEDVFRLTASRNRGGRGCC